MENPVFAADGYTYERKNIEEWLKTTNESPVTKESLPHHNLVPNHQLHGEIEVATSDFYLLGHTQIALYSCAGYLISLRSLEAESCATDSSLTEEETFLMKFLQSWKELKEDGSSSRVGDTEVIPLVGAARSSKVKPVRSMRFGLPCLQRLDRPTSKNTRRKKRVGCMSGPHHDARSFLFDIVQLLAGRQAKLADTRSRWRAFAQVRRCACVSSRGASRPPAECIVPS
jgi:hypothetical protein